MSAGNIGFITKISGPVVDVQFPESTNVPDIFHAVEVTIQPREATLTEAEIEALSAKIVAAAEKATGAKLRG